MVAALYLYANIYLGLFFSGGGAIIILLLIFLHINRLYSRHGRRASAIDDSGMLPMLIHVSTFLVLALFFVNLSLNILRNFGDLWSDEYCIWLTRIAFLAYNLADVSMYFIFISRIALAFDGTVLQYSHCFIGTLYSLLVVMTGVALYGQTRISGHIDTTTTPEMPYCDGDYPIWGPALVIAFDIFFSFETLFLFLRPLFKLLNNGKRDPSMLQMVSRLSLLTLLCVISTLVSMVLLVFLNWGWQGGIDSLINCACVQMMSSYYRREYRKCCKPLEQCCFERYKVIDVIESVVSPRSSKYIIFSKTSDPASGSQRYTENPPVPNRMSETLESPLIAQSAAQ